ncbi:hypothetical protein FHR32_008009 [Streptosporangium album]|uniref:Uncharacterized protein n=1 Tax=Streptosporangium album TaxID=47479 RepID=A0A7W7S479_9ACTN|nr:hypothetical protein [Streptosporangium album]
MNQIRLTCSAACRTQLYLQRKKAQLAQDHSM